VKFNLSYLNGTQVPALGRPEWEKRLTPADQSRALKLADDLGFWKVNCPEHFVIGKEHRELSGDHHVQATTALAFAAGVAPRLKLSSFITILPLLNPIVQAKLWATLDWVSGGRAVMTVGVGWHEEEYDMLGVPFHERGRLCDEQVAAMLELWTSDNPTFEGQYVKFKDVGFEPKPVQKPAIPIWFGGDAKSVMRRVAKWGAGWSPQGLPPEQIPEKLDWIRSQPEYRGQTIEITYSTTMRRLEKDHTPRNDSAGEGLTDRQELIDHLGYLASLGVTETTLQRPPHADFEAYLDWLRWVSEEIAPHAR
jgi:probable F420-dependent oxidoreductase